MLTARDGCPCSTHTAYLPACSAAAVLLHLAIMLRRFHKQAVEVSEAKLERKRSKRQRVVEFFRSRKQKPQGRDVAPVRPPGALASLLQY